MPRLCVDCLSLLRSRLLCQSISFRIRIRHKSSSKIPDLSNFPPEKIRNFGILAHIDHGKSTLADRILELAGVLGADHKNQMLDKLQVERERGITVKAQACSLHYKDHLLNLIDTPGHVDFNNEVRRSLTALDGILLLVAANQGVQAQTLANFWLAFEHNIKVIPVINKIDLKAAAVLKVEEQMKNLFEFKSDEILRISAKNGTNIASVLDAIIERIPAPSVVPDAPFKSFIFDSWFDHFRGAIALILVKEGSVIRGQKIRSFHNQKFYDVQEVGIMYPDTTPVERLYAGQVGYIVAKMKSAQEAQVGDTLFDASIESTLPLANFKSTKPTVFAGLFPVDTTDYDSLKQALERLHLNDPSVVISSDFSPALGSGWKIGFLGLLHMEVFGARLEQEYHANVILTSPSIEFRARIKNNESIRKKRYNGKEEISVIDSSKFPNVTDVEMFMEPMVKVTIIMPDEYLDKVDSLCNRSRGTRFDLSYIDESKILLHYRLPLANIVIDFFESLKRITSGYASFDYESDGYEPVELVKVVISINGKTIDEFSQVLTASMASERAKIIVRRLKNEIPRQQFEINIKATFGQSSKTIAGAVIAPIKRDFTQLLKGNFGGGDRLGKKLAHQKEGKARMKLLGNVRIPKEAFINVLRSGDL